MRLAKVTGLNSRGTLDTPLALNNREHKLVVKLITSRGGGGSTGSCVASWGTSGPVRIIGRGFYEHGHLSESGLMQSLKRVDPESHALAWRRGNDGALLVKKNLAAAATVPTSWQRAKKCEDWAT